MARNPEVQPGAGPIFVNRRPDGPLYARLPGKDGGVIVRTDPQHWREDVANIKESSEQA